MAKTPPHAHRARRERILDYPHRNRLRIRRRLRTRVPRLPDHRHLAHRPGPRLRNPPHAETLRLPPPLATSRPPRARPTVRRRRTVVLRPLIAILATLTHGATNTIVAKARGTDCCCLCTFAVAFAVAFQRGLLLSRVILSASKRALCARRGGDPSSLLTLFRVPAASPPPAAGGRSSY